jgi:hypothetical protein
MMLSCHGIREYVSYLEINGNMKKRYNTSVPGFSNRMTVYHNMLHTFMVLYKKLFIHCLLRNRHRDVRKDKRSRTKQIRKVI